MQNCYSHDNTSGYGCHGFSANYSRNITFRRNVSTDNRADGNCAGIWIFNTTDALLENNTVTGNKTDGIIISFTGVGCVVRNNISTSNGSTGIEFQDENGAYPDAGAISYNDVWGNGSENYNGCSSTIGGISAYPQFQDTAAGDYRLTAGSPCIDSGDPNSAYNDPDGTRCEIGAIPYLQYVVRWLAVDTLEDNSHVVSPLPLISWSAPSDGINDQTRFEIAVGTDNDWAFSEMWNPAPFETGDTSVVYAGGALADGATYYVRLRVHNGLAWSEWYESSFRMNSVPSGLVASGPIDEAVVATAEPVLWMQNASDAEGDAISYDIRVVADTTGGGTAVAEATGVVSGTDSTGWMVTAPLAENERFFWQARAFDGYEYGEWTEWGEASFWVNSVEEGPSAPVMAEFGVDSCCLTEMHPTFVWEGAEDPDPFDTVGYRVHVAVDPGFAFAAVSGLLADTSFMRPDSLAFNEQYWWKVTSEDKAGLIGESGVETFWTWTLGDADNNHALNVGDLTFLVGYLFRGEEEPCDPVLGDADGSCVTNVGDLTYLVSHLFKGGAAPAVCQ